MHWYALWQQDPGERPVSFPKPRIDTTAREMLMERRMKHRPEGKERRKSSRTRLEGEVECGIVSVDSAELHDISHTGLRFKSLKRLNPNSRQKIVIHFDSTVLNVRGTIVRSMISNSARSPSITSC